MLAGALLVFNAVPYALMIARTVRARDTSA